MKNKEAADMASDKRVRRIMVYLRKPFKYRPKATTEMIRNPQEEQH
jgi:hypothetical protein